MISMLVTYAIIGTFLAVSLLRTHDPFTFALLTISAAMFMTAVTVIMEYSSAVVNPDDHDILGHRPVSSRTYFWAKIANLLFYVCSTALALSLPASIAIGLRFSGGIALALTYGLMSLVGCVSAAALVVLLYSTAIRVFDTQRFNTAITYVHSVATLVLTFGYVLVPRMLMREGIALEIAKGRWAWFVPPAWYAGAVEFAGGGTGPQNVIFALMALGSAGLVLALAMSLISLDYSRRISELAAVSSDVGEKGHIRPLAARLARIERMTCRSDEERAGFDLMGRYMHRDRKLRMRVYPAFGLPLAVYLFGLVTGSFADPFGPRNIEPGFPIQELLGFYCVFITLFFATAMTQSDQWRASWIFHAAPVHDRVAIIVGARKLVIWRYLIPFFAILFLLLSVVIPPLSAAVYLFLTLLLSLLSFSLLSLASPYLPLSQSVEKTRQARQLGLVMLLGLAMGALVAIKETIREAPVSGAVAIALLAALAVLSEVALRKRLRARLARAEFDG
jgi:ABC-2 type transport system permease protein